MSNTINLAEARKKLPELADRAGAGQTYVLARRGREIAVIIGLDEYRRLQEQKDLHRQQDFDALLAPPAVDVPAEAEARELALRVVRETRQARYDIDQFGVNPGNLKQLLPEIQLLPLAERLALLEELVRSLRVEIFEGIGADREWLKLAETAFSFWDNEEDAVNCPVGKNSGA